MASMKLKNDNTLKTFYHNYLISSQADQYNNNNHQDSQLKLNLDMKLINVKEENKKLIH